MPRLVTDPQAGADYFDVELDGKITRVDAVKQGDLARLEMDVTDISIGQHTARVAAGGTWGVSDFSDPFTFEKVLPSVPSGIGLEA